MKLLGVTTETEPLFVGRQPPLAFDERRGGVDCSATRWRSLCRKQVGVCRPQTHCWYDAAIALRLLLSFSYSQLEMVRLDMILQQGCVDAAAAPERSDGCSIFSKLMAVVLRDLTYEVLCSV